MGLMSQVQSQGQINSWTNLASGAPPVTQTKKLQRRGQRTTARQMTVGRIKPGKEKTPVGEGHGPARPATEPTNTQHSTPKRRSMMHTTHLTAMRVAVRRPASLQPNPKAGSHTDAQPHKNTGNGGTPTQHTPSKLKPYKAENP